MSKNNVENYYAKKHNKAEKSDYQIGILFG